MSRILFINVTAAQHGGALTIAQQFIDAFAQRPPAGTEAYIFCTADLDTRNCAALKLVQSPRKGFLQRLSWDYYGIRKWSRGQNIKPGLILSLQNTGVFFGKIPQLIYLHNAIPFAPESWNPFKKEQRMLWFYRHIYPLFIGISIFKRTRFIVQTGWMKKALAAKFNFPEQKILVARPSFVKDSPPPVIPVLDPGACHFFYPASPVLFKNHLEIIRAVIVLRTKLQNRKIRIYFTCKAAGLPAACRLLIQQHNLEEHFVFLDALRYEAVLGYYLKADGLLFPSLIETVGLPLLEAASCGMPVVAIDKDFSREILSGYDNVQFVPGNEPEAWADAMMQVALHGTHEKRLEPAFEDDWIKVLSLIENILNNVPPEGIL